MKWLDSVRSANASSVMRLSQLFIGVVLVISTPVIALLPGPGGIIVFGLGSGLVLRNSAWAKRRYVIIKRRQPKLGGWADWGLRRKSARRRARNRETAPQGD